MSEHHSTRYANTLKKDRERQKKRRDELKGQGAPTTHVLNRALAEGFFYWLDEARARGVPVNEIKLSAQDVMVYAGRVLIRQTNATDHYNHAAVAEAIRRRVRNNSKFRMKPTWKAQRDAD